MGWKRDLPDFRDRTLALAEAKKSNLPHKIDLRQGLAFPVYEQGDLGSCTANAVAAAFHYGQIKQGFKDFDPSRLFIYYNERVIEGSVHEDTGAYLRDGVKALQKVGCCAEPMWPYDEAKWQARPPKKCFEDAAKNKCKEYARVPQTLEDMKGCLNEGFPFVFGFIVLESFMIDEVEATGNMLMPLPDDCILGGHAAMACGYDDSRRVFILRNSWGAEWGDKGYFYMPYDYMANPQLVQDLWTIRLLDVVDFPTTTAFARSEQSSAC